jgi:hypothetical protein
VGKPTGAYCTDNKIGGDWIEEIRKLYEIIVGKPLGKRALGRQRMR